VDQEDLLEIELVFCAPLVPNSIAKIVVTEGIALSSLEKILKTEKLHSGWFSPSFSKLLVLLIIWAFDPGTKTRIKL
jgi:hypothetical protein